MTPIASRSKDDPSGDIPERTDITRQALRRRGLLTGMAALVAGLAATKVSEPAAAHDLDDVKLANGFNDTAYNAANGFATRITATGNAKTALYGVYSGSGDGVPGVRGDSAAPHGPGLQGVATGTDAPGVLGVASSGAGVCGQSTDGTGVSGESTNATGVSGLAADGTGVYGGSGTANGVVGESTTGTGVYGSSGDGNGLVGASTNGSGVIGQAGTGVNARAGTFIGKVVVDGDFQVTGAKSAIVPHPDGSHRIVYCVESPESWFEDFGAGQLVAGRAVVALDRDFAALVDAAAYHVFVTPYGETKGLFVTARTPVGFIVQEVAGGVSGAAFTYRVVAKRGDIPAPRLAPVDLPPVQPLPAVSKPPVAPVPQR